MQMHQLVPKWFFRSFSIRKYGRYGKIQKALIGHFLQENFKRSPQIPISGEQLPMKTALVEKRRLFLLL
ncbi:MAG: hypothetical protein D6732_18245 [Methanobacteriota archaeon]|nr:MAG: hypothetical protein D6732_18245 [Euryarchaeota archaeon]